MANAAETAFRPVEKPPMPVAKVRYLDEGRKANIFSGGKPESFEIFTPESQSRIYGQLIQMDKYLLYLGTAQAQNEVSKLKGNSGIQAYRAADLRTAAEVFLELANILEGKIR